MQHRPTLSVAQSRLRYPRLPASRLALAVRAGMLGLALAAALPHPAQAQTAAAPAEQRVTVDLPAGQLDQSLDRLARSANVNLSYDPALVEGKTAPAVKGAMTVQQAMQNLLQSSGLEAIPQAGGGYQLQRAPADNATTLRPVRVTAAADVAPNTTEGTNAYTIKAVSTATRLALTPRETPQTISIVTRQQMDDFAMTDVDDVLESTSGVHVFDRGSNGAFYYSRGFALQTQYDGIANPIGIGEWNMNPSPDGAFLDHVEVLQGASGLLTGAGEPGGVINLVRKRPTHDFTASIEGQLGSWDKQRLVGDISGPLVKSEAIRGRAVLVWDETDSFVDYMYDDRQGFYGVIDADITSSTLLNASIQYQKNDARSHGGVPMAWDGSSIGFSRSRYFGNANASNEKEYFLYTVSVEQRLPQDWVLKVAYTENTTEVDGEFGSFLLSGPLEPSTGNGLNLSQHRFLEREFKSNSWDVHATGPLQLFGRQHELVIGANGLEMHERTRNSGNSSTPVNVYTFNPAALPTPPGVRGTLDPEDETQQHGFYGVARINLADSLKLIIGARASWYHYIDSDGLKTHDENGELAPYVGIIYDLNKNFSVYASYSDIFTPQSNLSRSGSPIDPVVGTNYETGIKGEFYDGKLNTAAALFRLEQTNLATVDQEFGNDPTNICGGWCYIAEDEIISEGVDLSVDGEVVSGWNVGGGYTYVSSEYASGAQDGNPYRTDVPENLFRVYTTYRLLNTGWTVGGNVNVQSRFYSSGVRNGRAWRVEQGGLTLVGLIAKYAINKNAQISLAADNIFDKKYYASTNNLYYVPYGEPRKLTVSAKYIFD